MQVIERTDRTIQYKLKHKGQRKVFIRSELQKVDPKNLIKSGQKTKEDLSFGQHFDLENHLDTIRGKESNISQKRLEEIHKDDVTVSRPKRERKQVQKDFMVNF